VAVTAGIVAAASFHLLPWLPDIVYNGEPSEALPTCTSTNIDPKHGMNQTN